MAIDNPTNFITKCFPELRPDIDYCGSLTACQTNVLTPDQWEGVFTSGGEFNLMRSALQSQFVLKACGAKQSPFVDFVNKNVKIKSLGLKDDDLVRQYQQPFYYADREWPINNAYWTGLNGFACDVGGGANPAGAYWSMDMYTETSMPLTTSWFLAADVLYIVGQSNGTRTETMYQIVSSTLNTDHITVVMSALNSGSYFPSSQLTDPVQGIVQRAPGNVAREESYCNQAPSVINTTTDEFWFQFVRMNLCEDERVMDYMRLLMDQNPLAAKYYLLEPVEHNRQVGMDFQMGMANLYMRQKPLPNQRLATLSSLPAINGLLPTGSYCAGRKANAIGWLEQHAQCDRVFDAQGAPLQIQPLATELERMMRIREFTGHPEPTVFELLMPSAYAPAFGQAMLAYWKARGQDTVRTNIALSSGRQKSPLGFIWESYWLEYPQVELRVITDRFFDDQLDYAHRLAVRTNNSAFENLGRQIWIMDWRKNYVNLINSWRDENLSGDLHVLASADPGNYYCRANVAKKKITMTTQQISPVSECPAADLIITNFSGETPNIQINTVDYSGGISATNYPT